jgi:hypothetical protein
MDKDIIKNTDNSKTINKTKVEINSQQAEESQKKAINKTSSMSKAVKSDEPIVTMRDFSGKIKYNRKKNERKNTDNQQNVVKAQNVPIVKETTTTDNVVKSQNKTTAFRHNSSVANAVIKGKSNTEKTKNKPVSSYNNVKRKRKRKAYRYKDESEIVREKSENIVVDIKQLTVDVLPQNQQQAISSSAKEYLADNEFVTDNKRSKLSELAHHQAIKSISDKNKFTTTPKEQAFDYTTETSKTEQTVNPEFNYSEVIEDKKLPLINEELQGKSDTVSENVVDTKRSKLSEIAHQKAVKSVENNNISVINNKPQAFVYTDETSKMAQSVKSEFTYNDVVKDKRHHLLKIFHRNQVKNQTKAVNTNPITFYPTVEKLQRTVYNQKPKIRRTEVYRPLRQQLLRSELPLKF